MLNGKIQLMAQVSGSVLIVVKGPRALAHPSSLSSSGVVFQRLERCRRLSGSLFCLVLPRGSDVTSSGVRAVSSSRWHSGVSP